MRYQSSLNLRMYMEDILIPAQISKFPYIFIDYESNKLILQKPTKLYAFINEYKYNIVSM